MRMSRHGQPMSARPSDGADREAPAEQAFFGLRRRRPQPRARDGLWSGPDLGRPNDEPCAKSGIIRQQAMCLSFPD